MEKLKNILGVIFMAITIIITVIAAITGYREYKVDRARARRREHEMYRREREERRRECERNKAAHKAA